jgi:hypothetical protein
MPSFRRLLVTATTTIGLLVTAGPALATPTVTGAHIVAHFDITKGQTPENITVRPDGSADLTFALAAQVARVGPTGRVQILAQLPTGAGCPLTGAPGVSTGIVQIPDGTFYVGLCTGSAGTQGVWRVRPDGSVKRFAALPANGVPNGLALDPLHGYFYMTDSYLSTVWRISLWDGTATAWATGPELAPDGFIGANGLKLHDDAVWVTNTQHGTLLRIPIRPNGAAGPIQQVASGLSGIDDFDFTGPGPDAPVLAAVNSQHLLVLIRRDGTWQTELTAADGLSNPSSVAVQGSKVYVDDSAFLTQQDPNLLVARLSR